MGRIIYWNNRMWFENPLQLGPVLLYQAGEAYINGYMPSDGHKQFCFEITFVVSGKCINYTADEYCLLSKGDVIINSPGALHGIEIAHKDCLRFLFLGFDFDESHPDFEVFREMRDFFQKNNGVAVKNTRHLEEKFVALLDEVATLERMQGTMLYSMVAQILITVYREYIDILYKEKKVFPSDSVDGRIVYDTIHYIDAHFLEMEHLREISDKLGYSYPYLARVFMKKMGISIGEYYNRKRFEEAVRMMRENVTLTVIAERLGYSTIGAFSKAFSNHFKMSPSDYKRQFLSD